MDLTKLLEESDFLQDKFDIFGELQIPDEVLKNNNHSDHFVRILKKNSKFGYKVLDMADYFYMGFTKEFKEKKGEEIDDGDNQILRALSTKKVIKYDGKG